MMNNIVKLSPYHIDKIWGYEKWILSTHKNGLSFIDGGSGTLLDYIGSELPILVKEIKANDNLSVQVHPHDDYAKKYENELGKTECWYILEAEEDSTLICGIKEGVTKDNFRDSIENNNVENILKKVSVKSGDMIYIPAGTVHAIEGGITILEIQQCSDVTYRIYDWGRDREIHVKKALDVINFNNDFKYGKIENFKILETPYFKVEKLIISDTYECSSKNYNVFICISGSGHIVDFNGDSISMGSKDVVYVKDRTDYKIRGTLELLKIY